MCGLVLDMNLSLNELKQQLSQIKNDVHWLKGYISDIVDRISEKFNEIEQEFVRKPETTEEDTLFDDLEELEP